MEEEDEINWEIEESVMNAAESDSLEDLLFSLAECDDDDCRKEILEDLSKLIKSELQSSNDEDVMNTLKTVLTNLPRVLSN